MTTRPFQWQLAPIQNNHENKYKKYTIHTKNHSQRCARSIDGPLGCQKCCAPASRELLIKHISQTRYDNGKKNNYYINKNTKLPSCCYVCVVTKHKQPPSGHPSTGGCLKVLSRKTAPRAQVAPKFVHKINKSDSLKQIMFHPAPQKVHPTLPRIDLSSTRQESCVVHL